MRKTDVIVVKAANLVLTLASADYKNKLYALIAVGDKVFKDEDLSRAVLDKMRAGKLR